MSVQSTASPEVRPLERGIYQIGERRERAPKQPFPDVPERDGKKREPERDAPKSDTLDPERRIDIRV